MNKAIVYYTIMVFLGMLSGYLYFFNKVIALIFFITISGVMAVTIKNKYAILMIIFLILGFGLFYQYFNIDVPRRGVYELKLDEYKEYYTEGEYKGRRAKLNLPDNKEKIKEGSYIKGHGVFKKEISYENGFIGTIYIDTVKETRSGILQKIYEFKNYTIDSFKETLGDKRAAVINGVAYGMVDSIDEDTMNQLKTLGIIHVISVSGLHIALVFSAVEKVFGYKVALIICFLYVIFTGSKAATIRSFIMIMMMKLSKCLYKKYNPLSALCTSALILLVYKPYFALNMGFHLSYISTLGIILFYNKIRKLLYKLPEKINSNLSLCLSAQVFVFPYTAFSFNNFALGFVIGNMILIPLYSVLVVLGMIYIPIQFIPVLKNVSVFLIGKLIDFIYFLCGILTAISPNISYMDYAIGIIYMAFLMGIIFYFNNIKWGKALALSACICAAISSYNFFPLIFPVKEGYEHGITVNDGFKRELIIINEGKSKKLRNKYAGFEIKPLKDKNMKVKLNSKYGILVNENKRYLITDKDYETLDLNVEGCIYTILNGKILKIGGVKGESYIY